MRSSVLDPYTCWESPPALSARSCKSNPRTDPARRGRPLQRRTQEERLGVSGRRRGSRRGGGRRSGLGSGGADDGGVLDDVKLGVLLVEKSLALLLDGALFVGGGIRISIIELLDDLHAFLVDGGERSEAHTIEAGIVAIVYEDLRGAGVRAGHGIGDVAALVVLQDGIILDGGVAPGGGNRGIGADTELGDEARDDAENDHVVVEMVADEIVEAVGAVGSPGAGDVHDEIAARGFKFHLESVGRLLLEEIGLAESDVVFRSGCLGLRGGLRRSGSLR